MRHTFYLLLTLVLLLFSMSTGIVDFKIEGRKFTFKLLAKNDLYTPEIPDSFLLKILVKDFENNIVDTSEIHGSHFSYIHPVKIENTKEALAGPPTGEPFQVQRKIFFWIINQKDSSALEIPLFRLNRIQPDIYDGFDLNPIDTIPVNVKEKRDYRIQKFIDSGK